MIIVKLMGGIGNQMFQYAVGRNLAYELDTELKLDLTFLLDRTTRENFIFRDFDLDIFNIYAKKANQKDLKLFFGKGLISRIRRKLLKAKIIKEPHFHFSEEILSSSDNSYLIGYWQSEKYFKKNENLIIKDFKFNFTLDDKSDELAEKIIATESVCLNVRRTDFVTNPAATRFHGVCDLEYFHKAIEYLVSKKRNLHIFIFSDDIEWCINNFKISGKHTFVTHEYAGEKFKYYLKLMTLCKHFIIPNSTFGWWAAWLAENKDKIIIAPKKWFAVGNINTYDLIPEEWKRF